MPFVRRTRATLRSAEFGFFGVVVYTRVQTPRRCGHACSAGLAVLYRVPLRPLRTSWLKVGTNILSRTINFLWSAARHRTAPGERVGKTRNARSRARSQARTYLCPTGRLR